MTDWGAQKWRFSATAQDPKNETTNEALVRRAKTLVHGGLFQTLGVWEVGTQLRYSGSKIDKFYDRRTYITSVKNLKSATLLDLTATRTLTPDLRLNLRVENATNENYQSIYGYNMPKRGLFVGLRWAPAR
jgi:vitamin B12 transporter